MPPRKVQPFTTGCFGRRLTATALVSLPLSAFADHGVPVPARGFGWMSWLLVVGAVIAVGLAAWAFFAPERGSEPSDPSEPVETRPEPPAR